MEDEYAAERVELVVLGARGRRLRCRCRSTDRVFVLQGGWNAANGVPGWIISVDVDESRPSGRQRLVRGRILCSRLDVEALNLEPLGLTQYGRYRDYEMEQVLPELKGRYATDDPVYEAVEHLHSGRLQTAWDILNMLTEIDLRCLDAHAHMGLMWFNSIGAPVKAAGYAELSMRHYEAGVQIGELCLPPGFSGRLPWPFINNRPFLRCLQGYALCLWVLGRAGEAKQVFQRIQTLDRDDHLGVRVCLADIAKGLPWTPEMDYGLMKGDT